ncbi:MAG: PKD domain-containing protein [Bacteroidota bacterium]
MRKTLVPPPPMMEQAHLRSRVIEKAGFDDYGIIFLTLGRVNPGGNTLNDLKNLDPDSFLGATLENTLIKGDPGLFKIIGGYFIEKSNEGGKKTVKLSKVFGIVKDSSKGFGLKDGSDTMIGDSWKLKNHFTSNERALIDERELADDGWTFVVEHEDGKIYPPSLEPVNIYTDCPEIKFSHYIYQYPDNEIVNASFHLRVKGEGITAYEWDLGDGTTKNTKKPEVKHSYTRPFGEDAKFTVSVSSKGPGSCDSSDSIPIKIPGREHPALESVTETNREKSQDKKETTIDFVAKLEKADNPHETYTWDFGDGSDKVIKKGPEGLKATHTYKNKDDFSPHKVTVDGKGPESCESSVLTSVRLDPVPVDCPVIGQVKQIAKTNLNGGEQTQYKLRAEFTGVKPNQFVWTWDEDQIKTTDEPEVDIVLTRTDEDNRPVIIKLDTIGPGTCRGESDICVHVPGLGEGEKCPWYLKAMPYALGLLFTMLICAVITCYVGISMGEAIEGGPTDHLYTWTIVLAFATMILGFIWAVIGKKSACGPRLCNILLIMATGLIGSSIFSALIGNCFESYLPLFVILLILGILVANARTIVQVYK